MKIYNCIKDFKPIKNAIVTIGTFDGVHLGHQAIFKKMRLEAEQIGGETVVITFFPHPRIVLGLDSSNLKFINTQEKKINRIEESEIDHLVIVSFTKQFASMSSEDFLRDLVIEKIKPAKVIIGYDHHFGKNREGSFKLLSKMGKEYGFEVEEVEAQLAGGTTISSTKIREFLKEGNISQTNELLGYEYSITGNVVKGQSIGRKLGFPTANIEIADEYKLIAAVGVYACRVEWMGNVYKGMSNIGFRPTVDHGELTIEVHIFNFNKNLYGEEITISFVERLRDEKKFESLEALTAQLVKDEASSLKIL